MTDPRLDYDTLAHGYDERYEERSYEGVGEVVGEVAPEGAAVLDVGCGTGRWLELLRARRRVAFGVDPSREMLRIARKRLGPDRLARARAEALPFASTTFDAVVVVNALHHFTSVGAFASEARRVLRPGGRVLTVGLDPSRGLDQWYVYDYFEGARARDVRRYPSCRAIRAELGLAGLHGMTSRVAHRLRERTGARRYLEAGRAAKGTASALALLPDAAYAEGLARIERAIREAGARGEELTLRADLDLWATWAEARA